MTAVSMVAASALGRPGGPRGAPSALGLARGWSRQREARRVLVVDDDPDILSTLASALGEMLGMPVEVATAPSGVEAKGRIERGERFDLVLTDEKMPGMTGSELLAWLRQAQPGTARVLMSAFYEGWAARDLADRAGAQVFIQKPFELDPMLTQLRRLLGQPPA